MSKNLDSMKYRKALSGIYGQTMKERHESSRPEPNGWPLKEGVKRQAGGGLVLCHETPGFSMSVHTLALYRLVPPDLCHIIPNCTGTLLCAHPPSPLASLHIKRLVMYCCEANICIRQYCSIDLADGNGLMKQSNWIYIFSSLYSSTVMTFCGKKV